MASCFKKQLVLIKLQDVLKCLKHFSTNASEDFDEILSGVYELQALIGGYTLDSEIRSSIFDPFISLLQLNILASPYILCVLEAIQYFIFNSVVDASQMISSTKLPEIVDSIVSLKYVQTDESMDDMVHLQAIQALGTILNCKYGESISKLTVLNILNHIFNSILHDNLQRGTMLRSISVNLLNDYIRNIVDKLKNRQQHDYVGYVPDVISLIVDRLYNDCSVLSDLSLVDLAEMERANEPGLDLGVTDTVEAQSRPFILYLKILTSIFNSLDNLDICFLFSRDPNLLYIIRESFSFSLLKLINVFIRSGSVMNLILTLHSTLYYLIGPSILLLNENIFKLVYMRGLQETSILLKGKLLKSVVKSDPGTYFCQDILETILDFLCSFISDSNFIPSVFVAFDCDLLKPNICENMCELIVDCGRLAYKLRIQDDGLETDHVMIGTIRCYQAMTSSFISSACNDVPDIVTSSTEFSTKVDEESGGKVGDSSKNSKVSDKSHSPPLSPLLDLLKDRKDHIEIACKKFKEKPEKCFLYLQEVKMMPTPLTSASVSAFLRNTPSLPKDKIGAYIGELGKDHMSDFDCNGVKFHDLVLKDFAKSFNLDDLNILDALRVFLSAFRLPGEAQQIDRILVAFSEHCHNFCRESRSGFFEHSDVLYLLSFSIIMLNTDRHNQNIAQKNKMTMEQFIKNNTFYGAEYHQTKPISRELLEDIYNSISMCPLATNEPAKGKLSKESWIDKQLQTKFSPNFGYSYSFGWCDENFERLMSTIDSSLQEHFSQNDFKSGKSIDSSNSESSRSSGNRNRNNDDGSAKNNINDCSNCESRIAEDDFDGFSIRLLHKRDSGRVVASNKKDFVSYLCKLLCKNITVSALDIMSHLRQLLSKEKEKNVNVQVDVALTSFLYNTLFNAIQINSAIGNYDLNDTIILVLLDLCFSLNKTPVLTPRLSKLLWGSNFDLNSFNTSFSISPEDAVDCLLYSTCSRIIMEVISKLLTSSRHNLRKSWQFIWLLLCTLRDATILPDSMVVETRGEDILSESVRQNFEQELYTFHTKPSEEKLRQKKKKSSSFLSLLGLGFSSSGPTGSDVKLPPYKYEYSKWDCGYTLSDLSVEEDSHLNVIMSLRKFCVTLGLKDLVSDSRFLDDESLKKMILGILKLIHNLPNDSLVARDDEASPLDVEASGNTIAEGPQRPFSSDSSDRLASLELPQPSANASSLPRTDSDTSLDRPRSISVHAMSSQSLSSSPVTPKETSNQTGTGISSNKSSDTNLESLSRLDANNKRLILSKSLDKVLSTSLDASASSKSWLENILAELIIRNRERVAILWPLIEFHYALSEENIKVPSYTIERRVNGLFKIISRIVSRSQSTYDAINLLSTVFSKTTLAPFLQENSKLSPMEKPNELWFSRQFASGLQHFLTSNVSILPALTISQWQSLFDLIGLCSVLSESASLKAFEIMAWILREPLLIKEVPIFCVSAIIPLIRNAMSPLSVSIEAIKLLYHLHSRLEALVKQAGEKVVDRDVDADAHWEGCWVPILRAMADGASDLRVQVRTSSVECLCVALLDPHLAVVPTGLLVNIISDIVLPTFESYIVSNKSNIVVTSSDENDANTTNESSGSNQALEVKCFQCLAQILERSLYRLLVYPTFDKLWINVLGFFGNVLSCQNICSDANKLAAYRQFFVDLFCLFDKNEVFKDKPELLNITHQSLQPE